MDTNQTSNRKHILFTLFFATLYLSAFTFGGGYVIVTLLKDKFVNHLGWIEEEEMLDMIALAQSSPGAIAVNSAIVIGYKLAGIWGVLVSVLGAILPPMIILSLVSIFYDAFRTNPYIGALLNGMKAGVGAVIISVVYDMGRSIVETKDVIHMLIMFLSFCASYFFGINIVLIILLTALFGFLRTLLRERRRRNL